MAAKNGTITFSRPFSPSKMMVSIYLDDTAGHAVRFSKDTKADANSPDNFIANEILGVEDVCIEAATGQTTTIVKVNDISAAALLNANHLAAITSRPEPGVVLYPSNKLTLVQLA